MAEETRQASTYWKVPFEWRDQQLHDRSSDSEEVWTDSESDDRSIEVVAEVLSATPDASLSAGVEAMGPTGFARHFLAAESSWGMHHHEGWWQLLHLNGTPVGFVLPGTFDGRTLEGLDEGTIFLMGVRPDWRGQGLGRSLLRQATRTLLAHGVWKIYCDTALNNVPMIHLFESEGWKRRPAHERPI